MHMNFNQAAYAFVIGILLALLVEATDSIWSAVLYHFLFNAQSVSMLFLMKAISPGTLELAQEQTDMMQGDMLFYSLGIYFVLAAVCTTLAVMTLVWMARNENRLEEFRLVLTGTKMSEVAAGGTSRTDDKVCLMETTGKQQRMITLPLVLAVLVCLGYMILDVIFI